MGALTNGPQAFNSRTWECNSQLSYDLTDFLTPRIRIDQLLGKVNRILPTVEWISNRIRFLYLGLRAQRISQPIATYQLSFDFLLKEYKIYFSKKVLLYNSYAKTFAILKMRLNSKLNKKVNFILGSVWDSNINLFSYFENNQTKINYYSELSVDTFYAENLAEVSENKTILLAAVNPRMESPLLNLKIKELALSKIYSIGNFSFSYPVKVVSNNSYFLTMVAKGLKVIPAPNLVFFGLSSLNYSNYFKFLEKITLIPIYFFNSLISTKFDKQIAQSSNFEDINVHVMPQLVINLEKSTGFNFFISTHFDPDFSANNFTSSLTLPVSGYLETNFKFFNKDLILTKISGLKPSFNLNDFCSSFSLYLNQIFQIRKQGNLLFHLDLKKKVKNAMINNSVPNYLIREPLGRLNPLFSQA